MEFFERLRKIIYGIFFKPMVIQTSTGPYRSCAAHLAKSNPILSFEFVCGLVSLSLNLWVRIWTDGTKKTNKMMKLTENGLPPTAKTSFDGTNIVNHTFVNFWMVKVTAKVLKKKVWINFDWYVEFNLVWFCLVWCIQDEIKIIWV